MRGVGDMRELGLNGLRRVDVVRVRTVGVEMRRIQVARGGKEEARFERVEHRRMRRRSRRLSAARACATTALLRDRHCKDLGRLRFAAIWCPLPEAHALRAW